MLIEVMMSALLVALIVVATFNGFDVTGRVTADERSHAQADVLAHQDEDRLRGLQVSELSGLSQTSEVTYNGTVYTIKSTAKFVSDATGSESCTGESVSADYIQTTSEVSWPALKSRPKVVETGLIAPRLGGSLLVQVTDASGKGTSGMTVVATGPSPSKGTETATTGTNGCVIFGSVEPGDYEVTTYQGGYVEKDGNSEPPTSEQSATVINGSTTKKAFEFDRGGELVVKFETAGVKSKGDAFLAFNTGMTTPSYRTFGTVGTQVETITTPKTLFPFSSSPSYVVYAGNCLADEPEANNKAIKDPTATLAPGGSATVTVPIPPIKIKVMNGEKAGKEGAAIEASGTLIDTGCEKESVESKRVIKTNSKGELPSPGMPYGSYSLCVTAVVGGKGKKLTKTFQSKEAAGITVPTFYLGGPEAKTESTCP